MIELSFAWATPLHLLRETLPERDLHLLHAYRNRYRFPNERANDYLKQVSAVTAAAGGAKDVRLDSFTLQYWRDDDGDMPDNPIVSDFKPRGSRKRSTL